MNSKQRTLCALRNQQPDRVPVYVTVVSELADGLARVTGVPADPLDAYLTNRISHAALLTGLGNDVVGIGATAPHASPSRVRSDGLREDEWGLVYRPVPHPFGTYQEVVGRPLAGIRTAKELAGYKMPDPCAPGRYDAARERSQGYGQDYALLGVIECTVFEMAWNLVGLEQFLVDMALRKDYVAPLLDAVADYSIGVGVELIRLGADVMLTGDDLGMDIGPMLSVKMWREYLKPRLARVHAAYRSANPDVIVAYHSCGSILPFIDELHTVGVQVLNPIQVTAAGMDPAALKARFGAKLTFFGAIDQRHVLPNGTIQEVENEVKTRMCQLGENGGYLLAPTHDIQADTPIENVLAVFDAVKKWGTYPLCCAQEYSK